jgi:LmbE family N-acetylglucosaminyl deacetylase
MRRHRASDVILNAGGRCRRQGLVPSTGSAVLLAVFAHPDDETFRCGGTLALLASRGVRVHILAATHGEAGSRGDPPLCLPEELAVLREKELACACRALGLQPPILLDYRDGHLAEADPEEVIERIVRAIRGLGPQAMLSFGPDGLSGHPDHVAIGHLAAEAFRRAGEPSAYPEQLDRGLMPHAPARLYQMAVLRSLADRLGMKQVRPIPDKEITLSVDVSPVWEKKMAAIRCHASQHGVTSILRTSLDRQRLFLGTETFRLALSRPGPAGEAGDLLEELGVPIPQH